MKNSELDRLSAEMVIEIMIKFSNGTFAIKTPPDERHIIWRPTDKDSNQAERYLFPKLEEVIIGLDFVPYRKTIIITPYPDETNSQWKCPWSVMLSCEDFDQINRTKVIAVLEAWDKLKGKE